MFQNRIQKCKIIQNAEGTPYSFLHGKSSDPEINIGNN